MQSQSTTPTYHPVADTFVSVARHGSRWGCYMQLEDGTMSWIGEWAPTKAKAIAYAQDSYTLPAYVVAQALFAQLAARGYPPCAGGSDEAAPATAACPECHAGDGQHWRDTMHADWYAITPTGLRWGPYLTQEMAQRAAAYWGRKLDVKMFLLAEYPEWT